MKIITHSGPFHADDVLGVANAIEYIRMVKNQAHFRPEIIRTRDKQLIEEGLRDVSTVMVDVGGEYDEEANNFDHHFVGAPVRENGQPYAAAGLTAKCFFTQVLDDLCLRVDLADNGITQPGWSLSMTIHKCNPLNGASEEFDRRFNYLVNLAHRALVEGIIYGENTLEGAAARFESDKLVIVWVEEHNKALTESELRTRQAFLQDGPFVVLHQYEPALMELAHLSPERKFYSIFPNPGGEWMVQQIPISYKSPKGRKPLPEEWAGLRGADLDAVTGVEGCVFVHHARFIGGHKTLDGALKMAELALSL